MKPDSARMLRAMAASRGVGASISTRSPTSLMAPGSSNSIRPPLISERAGLPFVLGQAGHDAPETLQRLAHLDAVVPDHQLAERPLVRAGPLLEDADGLPDLGIDLEVAEEEHGVREIAHVELPRIRQQEAVLGHDDDRHDPLLVEISEELVEVRRQEPLL